MYRVFVAQNRGRGMHIEISQNALQSINLLNRKLVKKKKKDRWRLVWFSGTMQRTEAIAAKRELERVNSFEAMKSAMKKFEEKDHERGGDSANLASKAKPLESG